MEKVWKKFEITVASSYYIAAIHLPLPITPIHRHSWETRGP